MRTNQKHRSSANCQAIVFPLVLASKPTPRAGHRNSQHDQTNLMSNRVQVLKPSAHPDSFWRDTSKFVSLVHFSTKLTFANSQNHRPVRHLRMNGCANGGARLVTPSPQARTPIIGFFLALERLVSPPNQANTSLLVVRHLVVVRSLRCASPPLNALYKVRERSLVTLTAWSLSTDHSAECGMWVECPNACSRTVVSRGVLPITWLTLLCVKVPIPIEMRALVQVPRPFGKAGVSGTSGPWRVCVDVNESIQGLPSSQTAKGE